MSKLYFYDLKSFELQKEQEIQLDSFGNEIAYFNATKVTPPAKKEGYALIFNKKEEQWEHVEDHRGAEGYIDGKSFKMKELGALPEGFITESPKPEYTPEQQLQMLRDERNYLLQKTDWALLPDSPLTEEEKEEYKVYRQWLRDVPQATTFKTKGYDVQLPKNIEEFRAMMEE